MKYNTKKHQRWREKCRRGGIASGVARRAKMQEYELELRPRDAGEFIGTLTWHGADGTKRKYDVKQAERKNQVVVVSAGKSVTCGWYHFLTKLRGHLSALTR